MIDQDKEESFWEVVDEVSNVDIKLDDLLLSENEKSILRRRLRINPDFRDAWLNQYSGRFYDDIYQRFKDEEKPLNLLLRLRGEPGRGKSYFSLFIVQLEHEYFGIGYRTCFSPFQAATMLAMQSREANVTGKIIKRLTYNIDETQKAYGLGSGAADEYFNEMKEFLRQAQINIHILNPKLVADTNYQIEVVGYTAQGYSKGIFYATIDKGLSLPMGYVVSKLPSENYMKAYKIEKDEFIRHFGSNESYKSSKDNELIDNIYKDLSSKYKETIRQSIILNKQKIADMVLEREFNTYNLPHKYIQSLINLTKLKYFKREIDEAFRLRTDNIMLNKQITRQKLNKLKRENQSDDLEESDEANEYYSDDGEEEDDVEEENNKSKEIKKKIVSSKKNNNKKKKALFADIIKNA